MTSLGEAQELYEEATSSVTDRVKSYGLSLLGTALLLAKEPNQSLLDVDLDGNLKWAAIWAGLALVADYFQFVWRALLWGWYQRPKERARRNNDAHQIASAMLPINKSAIFAL